jgi:ATP-dependent metalloprotease FtsH
LYAAEKVRVQSDTTRRRRRNQSGRRRLRGPGFWASLAIAVLLVAFVQVIISGQPHPTGRRIDFSTFVNLTERGAVKSAVILDQDSYVEGTFQAQKGRLVRFNSSFLTSPPTRQKLVDILTSNQVPFRIDQQYAKSLTGLLSLLLPTLILIVVFVYFIASYRQSTGLFSTRHNARRATDEDPTVTFDEVAAQDAAVAELRELAEFLSDPERFARLGARIPKGVLLYGPPGCGKTLLARALAGESGAAFYSISGSDFVEFYVGVGAARVRDLFAEARENTPAIVFIDEIDAVGRKRRSGPAASEGSSEEQSQALNQILAEMDGFSPAHGTIVVGATNRPDDLDQALLRPGRFDRAISVDRPDETGRAAVLAVHAKNKPLADDVELGAIARRAIGLTGADLESVMNEAALLAARAGVSEIGQAQLDAALTRVLEAPERQRRLSARDRRVGQQSLDAERVTFADVAGNDDALKELSEIKDFLGDPSRFARMGARFPRGFLLVGPPGCGKTLLARAVAGESNAAFLSVAATEFTEIFVGEGAGRVRDLFAQARAMAPAIVFIDEVDAIGTRREATLDGHREREQTLNQILIELDGFRQRDGVIVMAATNRPELLDAALVRAGRFDRTITLDLPDRAGRQAILTVHGAGKKLAADVDLDAVAGITRGLTGADLANVMNEAALLSARKSSDVISMSALQQAVERATFGISGAHVLTDEERRVLAYHEAGHAVVARSRPGGALPHMISIISSGRTLGRAWIPDTHDRVLHSRSRLMEEMAVLLGGRSAEKLIFGETTSGAVGDLARVGELASRMVRELGMSDELGAIGYGEDAAPNGRPPHYSEQTARTIDAEARKLVGEAEQHADAVLRTSREALVRIAEALLKAEKLSSERIEELAAGAAGAGTASPSRQTTVAPASMPTGS